MPHVFTQRAIVTAIHGMCFGCFFLMAAFGLMVGIAASLNGRSEMIRPGRLFLERAYLLVTVAFSWLAVISGTYLVYPWYRAVAPPQTSDLRHFSRQFLLSSAATAKWHTLGMEWKEHVSFLAPIAVTAVAYVCWRYRPLVMRDTVLQRILIGFSTVTIAAAGIAAATGALLNKLAPIF